VKTIKKKQKHKSRGSVRTVTKTVQNDSFFNFFSPPPSKYFIMDFCCISKTSQLQYGTTRNFEKISSCKTDVFVLIFLTDFKLSTVSVV
jgi:hypothetical protein